MKKITISMILVMLLVISVSGLELAINSISLDVKDYEIVGEYGKVDLVVEYDCETTLVESQEISGYDISYKDETISVKNNQTNITITTTIEKELSTPLYETVYTSYCKTNVKNGLTITNSQTAETKYLNLVDKDMTFSVKGNTLTTKDLTRGGSWNDRDLNSCWNRGVPCQQYDISNPENIETTLKIRDLDREVEKIE